MRALESWGPSHGHCRLFFSEDLASMRSGGRPQWLLLLFFSALLLFSFNAYGDGDAGIVIRFLESPRAFSSSSTAAFEFEVLDGGSRNSCDSCSVECKVCWGGHLFHMRKPVFRGLIFSFLFLGSKFVLCFSCWYSSQSSALKIVINVAGIVVGSCE